LSLLLKAVNDNANAFANIGPEAVICQANCETTCNKYGKKLCSLRRRANFEAQHNTEKGYRAGLSAA
jgi:hypothetical protein